MKTFPKATHEMAELIRNNLDFCREWSRERLLGWVQWFVNNERCYAVAKGGELVGVTLARYVDREEDCHTHYLDTKGPLCYIEVTVCSHPSALRAMYRMIWNHLGENSEKVAWMRHKYGNRITMVDMTTAKRRLMRN